MKQILLIISVLVINIGCVKGPIEPLPCKDSDCDTTKLLGKLDTLWTHLIDPNFSSTGTYGIFSISDHILLGYSPGLTISVSTFHKDSPQSSFSYFNDQINSIGKMSVNATNEFCILQRDGLTIRFDLPSMKVRQQHQFTKGWSANTFGQLLGNHYYTSRTNDDLSECYAMRAHVDDLTQWDTVYTLVRGPATGDSRPNIQSYNLWIHPHTGDSILIFQHRMAFPERVDVLAYNLNTRQVIWKHENITPNANSNHQQIFIQDNIAFFGGSTVHFAFDLFTGKILWAFNEPRGYTSFMIDIPAYCEKTNGLIVRGGTKLYSFIPRTGSLNWAIDIGGDGSSGSPTVHNGIIYITSNNRLMAIRSSDGVILYREFENGPKWGTPTFRGDITIDSVRNCLYVVDRLKLYAIKLYEEK